MHYEPLKNDKKTCIDMSNVTFQYPTNPQLIELNRTRKILTILTTFELVTLIEKNTIQKFLNIYSLVYYYIVHDYYYSCIRIWLYIRN